MRARPDRFEFFRSEAASGVLLILAASLALAWANSPVGPSYSQVFEHRLTIGAAPLAVSGSLHFWINDALMVAFFLLVGLEIKRELLIGELADPRRAVLPVGAAFGGAMLPAAIFLVVAGGSPDAARGWGIPMATDIAFALGVLALLGSRLPSGLRVFLAALAIVDDLIAVLVIAIFYTAAVSVPALAAAGAVFLVLVAANRAGVRALAVYGLLGLALWACFVASGIHPTVAGVALAMTVPVGRPSHGPVSEAPDTAPAARLEHAIQPWVSYVIVPVFALANAGVALSGVRTAPLGEPIVLGIVIGLVAGKVVGISAASWLVLRLRLARLPAGVHFRHIVGTAWLGGIGFTMSLFIAALAYEGTGALALAKVGILVASAIAATGGLVILGAVARADRRSAAEEASPVG